MADKIYGVHLGAAKYAVDIGDGSERGEYVNQDYILQNIHNLLLLKYCNFQRDLANNDLSNQ